MKNRRTLVLNNQYLPLSLLPLYTIPAEEAIHRQIKGNCTVVTTYDEVIGTQNSAGLKWPAVIANHNHHSFKKDLRLRREALFYRDHCRCSYCGRDITLKEMTFDHVIPESKGGKTTFENVVASCKKCNGQKSDSMSSEWKPKNAPWKPTFYQMLEIRKKYPLIIDHESWMQFIPLWTSGVYVRSTGEMIMPNGDRIARGPEASNEYFKELSH